MQAIDIVGLLVPVTYLLMFIAERLWPARRFPQRRAWSWLGAGFLVLAGFLSTVVPLMLPAEWLARHRWIDGSGLGVAGGALVGYLVLSAGAFALHRAYHAVPVLWRLTHQMHHSPQRVDIPGAFHFHPVEMVLQILLQLFVTVIVLGLDPLAAALTGYVAAFYALFQHWNVNTPAWLGYLVQRPEAHCLHHARGVHAYNYSDFPLWDMLTGTWRNPVRYQGEVGFDAPADRRMGAMLAFRDVNEPAYGAGSLGVTPAR
ncbi:sterol desaturase family protein [Ramlibacter solisilvae]|uniref:sterol desaturase family protein n=1 Tax=Ramlibacter tataouinensis TaxID=94132 RepID=UPI00077739A6|nr:sterol desaturase family protein [Ramlibacter tataouinensis]